jgi:hypothetical protein
MLQFRLAIHQLSEGFAGIVPNQVAFARSSVEISCPAQLSLLS